MMRTKPPDLKLRLVLSDANLMYYVRTTLSFRRRLSLFIRQI